MDHKSFVSVGQHIREADSREIVSLICSNKVVFADAGDYYYSFHSEIHDGKDHYVCRKIKKRKYQDDQIEDTFWSDDQNKFQYYIFRLSSMYQRPWQKIQFN